MDDRLAVREKPLGSPVMFQRWSDLLFSESRKGKPTVGKFTTSHTSFRNHLMFGSITHPLIRRVLQSTKSEFQVWLALEFRSKFTRSGGTRNMLKPYLPSFG